MKTRTSLRIVVGLVLAGCSLDEPTPKIGELGAESRQTQYRYVSLDGALLPDGLFGDYFGLSADGRAFGNSWACGELGCEPSLVVYAHGSTQLVAAGAMGATVNRAGVVGGSVLIDPVSFITQAALFTDGGVELIPLGPNDFASSVNKVTDSGIALVGTFDSEFRLTYSLYADGKSTNLDLDADAVNNLDVNAQGLVSGTINGSRAFRHDPRTGETTILDPLPSEDNSWGLGIDSSGNVLGYSFIWGGRERIGYWDLGGTFHEWFVEGIPEVPTLSNALRWNEAGLIVITFSFSDPNSYIVPRPGVRLRLRDITTGPLPDFTNIVDVNDRGDLLGWGGSEPFFQEHLFLLQRI